MHMVRCGVQTEPNKQKLCLCNLFAVCHKKKLQSISIGGSFQEQIMEHFL